MILKAEIHNFTKWIPETNPEILKEKYNNLLLESGFGILGVVDHRFIPHGYTCLFLLSESHFAIHTFPEENKTYIELSSCVSLQFDKFVTKHSMRSIYNT